MTAVMKANSIIFLTNLTTNCLSNHNLVDWDEFNHKLFILPLTIDKSLILTFCVSVEVRLGSESHPNGLS